MHFFRSHRTIVGAMEYLTMPFETTPRIVVGTGVEQSEHVPERIQNGNTRVF